MALQKIASGSAQFTVAHEHILIVDDEDLIRETVAMALQEEGYRVMTAASGQQAVDLILTQGNTRVDIPIDLAIIDLMLPGVNGLDICRLIRSQSLDFPILILSARSTETDRVVGLEVGADDYLAKPFGMRELVARCRALLRRHRWSAGAVEAPSVLTYRDISLYQKEFRTLVNGQDINLSPKEFKILELFMNNPNRVWSREELISEVWGPDFMGDRKTVDVHIRWLREKIEPDPGNPQYVITLRGFGYRFG